MATVVKSVDELSSEDRARVVAALQLSASSLRRAVMSAKTAAIASATDSEHQAVQSLLVRFS